MNKKSRAPLWRKLLLIVASLILCVGVAASQALATLPEPCVNYTSSGNNFTMNNSTGGITGGTNDVVFTWDGTVHTPANSTTLPGVSNATLTSNEPFQAFLWFAHDVEFVGTGPLGGTGAAASFGIDADPLGKVDLKGFIFQVDVPAGMIAAHMLFDWGARAVLSYCCKANCDIDLWNVYDAGKAYQGLLCGSDSGQAAGICGDFGQAATPIGELTTTCHPTLPTAAIDGNPNVQAKLWDMVSVDISGRVLDTDGVTVLIPILTDTFPGIPFQDGPFAGFNGNFNMMLLRDPVQPPCSGCPPASTNPCINKYSCNPQTHAWDIPELTNCDDGLPTTEDFCDPSLGCQNIFHPGPTPPTLISPADGATGLGTTVELRWTKSTDLKNDLMTYHITYCKTPNAVGCASVVDVKEQTFAKRDGKGMFYAGGAGLLMIGMTFIGSIRGRKKIIVILIIVVLFAGGAFMSCKNTKVDQGTPLASNEVNYVVQGLDPGTTYYWRIEADNGFAGVSSSPSSTTARNFTTQ